MWTSQSVACSSGAHASYPVLVHRVAPLLRASFRPRLAAAPLRFANPSPPSGWVEDLHLLAVEHARHTIKRACLEHAPSRLRLHFVYSTSLTSTRLPQLAASLVMAATGVAATAGMSTAAT